jgi:hypothetical protein
VPLQNRVAPDGSLHAVPERGTMLGNRGGKFHRDDKTLGRRRWASEHWICCELHYKGLHHEAMGNGYTSLFFLDEVTALAAGHRPCFFCRRGEAKAFLGGERVTEFDKKLHLERTATTKAVIPAKAGIHLEAMTWAPAFAGVTILELPNGVMLESDGAFFAKRGNMFLRWSFGGYTEAILFNPALIATMRVNVLTAPSIIAILARGFKPRWHPSALQWEQDYK